MTDIPKGFVPIKQVAETFNTSRSTLDRRRVKAQKGSDHAVLKQFLLRTRDGVIHDSPSREQVQQFIKDGLVPEWFVSKAWLRKEYGERKTGESADEQSSSDKSADSTPNDTTANSALNQQYEDRIAELKKLLQQEREEKRLLLQYAQNDKQLFGNAVSNLTKVLTLPGVAGAIETANRQLTTENTDAADRKRGEQVAESASPKLTKKKKSSPISKPKTRKKSRWQFWKSA